jgi:hypothetical protein
VLLVLLHPQSNSAPWVKPCAAPVNP